MDIRIAALNVYYGLTAINSVYPDLAAVTAHQQAIDRHFDRYQPDVAVLCELSNADRQHVSTTFAARHNLPHVIFGNAGSFELAILSRFPIVSWGVVESPPGANEFERNPVWAELDLGNERKVRVYGVHASSICLAAPCSPENLNTRQEFLRLVQGRRLAEHIAAAHVVESMLTVAVGDFNDDVHQPQTATFSEVPANIWAPFVLGADLAAEMAEAPLVYSNNDLSYPDLAMSAAGLTRVPLFDRHGSPHTIPSAAQGSRNAAFQWGPLTADYAYVMGATAQGQIANSETEPYSPKTSNGEFPAYGEPLLRGDSVTASDHNMLVLDVVIP